MTVAWQCHDSDPGKLSVPPREQHQGITKTKTHFGMSVLTSQTCVGAEGKSQQHWRVGLFTPPPFGRPILLTEKSTRPQRAKCPMGPCWRARLSLASAGMEVGARPGGGLAWPSGQRQLSSQSQQAAVTGALVSGTVGYRRGQEGCQVSRRAGDNYSVLSGQRQTSVCASPQFIMAWNEVITWHVP